MRRGTNAWIHGKGVAIPVGGVTLSMEGVIVSSIRHPIDGNRRHNIEGRKALRY